VKRKKTQAEKGTNVCVRQSKGPWQGAGGGETRGQKRGERNGKKKEKEGPVTDWGHA